jgi:hypothetical protein
LCWFDDLLVGIAFCIGTHQFTRQIPILALILGKCIRVQTMTFWVKNLIVIKF